jgi:pyruvate decarboxylase
MLLHHTLGNGDFNVFANMNADLSVALEKLTRPSEIADQIDHALRECWLRSRPVYLMLPTDMVQQKIEGERLDTPIDLTPPQNDEDKENYVVDVVLRYLHQARNPIILVDACAIRHRVLDEVNALVEKTKLPVFVTPMGKGAFDETHPCYGGVYAGSGSLPEVAERVDAADLILTIGALKSDFNTGGFSYRTSQLNTIDFHSTYCVVRYSQYPGVAMKGVLRKITERVDAKKMQAAPGPKVLNEVKENRDDSPTITQAWFWPRIGEFLQENDIVVTETGTANFGILGTKFPRGVTALSQVLWGSIGWAVGAAQGACLATQDMGDNRRAILFEGEGSLTLTVQELSTMIRHGARITMWVLVLVRLFLRRSFADLLHRFCICNEGYTIERFIHGMDAEYNDVAEWKWKDLPFVFGATEKQARSFQVKTKDELESLLKDKDFNSWSGLQFVELHMPKKDAPRALILTAEASAKNNAKMED